jgi:hypothetical protein
MSLFKRSIERKNGKVKVKGQIDNELDMGLGMNWSGEKMEMHKQIGEEKDKKGRLFGVNKS